MKRLIIVALLASSAAYAQPAPQPSNDLILKVTQQELELISDGLQTQPFGKVVVLLNKLRLQIMEQAPKPPVTPPVEAPK